MPGRKYKFTKDLGENYRCQMVETEKRGEKVTYPDPFFVCFNVSNPPKRKTTSLLFFKRSFIY